MGFSNIASAIKELKQEVEDLKQEGVEATKEAARVLTREMMDRTPVWSGKTVRNYAWAYNSQPAGGQIDPIGGPGFVAGRNWAQQRQVDPGPTGSMGAPPAGEPRRAENEDAALAEMEDVLSEVDDLGTLTVTNNSEIWDLVDNGSAPTPERARNPGGVSILAEQAALAQLGDNFK